MCGWSLLLLAVAFSQTLIHVLVGMAGIAFFCAKLISPLLCLTFMAPLSEGLLMISVFSALTCCATHAEHRDGFAC